MNTSFPIKAVFFDVDGTLLSHETYSVPQSARESIDILRQRGIKTYLCTGRHALELELLPISDIPFDGYITLNGHLCLDHNKQLLFGFPFPEETAQALISVFRKKRIPLVLVEENRLILNYVNDTVIRAQEMISTPVPDIAEYDGAPIYQATTFAGLEDDDLIREITPPDCQAVRWNDLGIDLILKSGGKVTGIRCIIEQEGIRPEESIAFGDAENDIGMLKFCGIGVAMGNAKDQVKKIADYITSDADDDGIRNALQYYEII